MRLTFAGARSVSAISAQPGGQASPGGDIEVLGASGGGEAGGFDIAAQRRWRAPPAEGERVGELLARGAEAGADDGEEVIALADGHERRRPPVNAEDARSDLRRRLKGPRRDLEEAAGLGVDLDGDCEEAETAGRRRDRRRHLALEHDRRAKRRPLRLEEVAQDGGADVEGEVAEEDVFGPGRQVGRGEERGRRAGEDIGFDQADVGPGR